MKRRFHPRCLLQYKNELQLGRLEEVQNERLRKPFRDLGSQRGEFGSSFMGFEGSFILVLLGEGVRQVGNYESMGSARATHLLEQNESFRVSLFLVHLVLETPLFLVVSCVLDDQQL